MQFEEEEERMRQMINAAPRQWNTILKIMDDFDKWDFDVFQYCEAVGEENSLIHFGFKIFFQYGLLDKFSIADKNFISLLNSIRASTYEQNAYHNMSKIIELTRNFHYFTKEGNLMAYMSDLQIMSGFLACLVADVQHP